MAGLFRFRPSKPMARKATSKKPPPSKSTKSPKRGRGRPSGFKLEYCQAAISLGEEGKSKAQIARALGVSRQTLDNWADKEPEFLDALAHARDLALAWWEDQGQRGIWSGKEFNATAFGLQMKNRFPDDYGDRQHHTVDAKVDVNLDEVRNGIEGKLARIAGATGKAGVSPKP